MIEENNSCGFCQSKSMCFEKLSPIELELTDARRAELRYRKGEHIAKQGNFVTHVLYLKKGLIKVYMEVGNESDLILNIFSGGNFIGLPNLFNHTPLQYSVAAIEDSVVCAIDKKILEDLIQNNGEFAKSIIENINTCTLYHYKRLITASQKQLNGRMADALLHLSEIVYKASEFPMSLSRKELGELSGMSMMSAVRVIKDLEQNGVIEEKSGMIRILDKQKLENLSKYG